METLTDSKPLRFVGYELFQRYNLMKQFKVHSRCKDTVCTFLFLSSLLTPPLPFLPLLPSFPFSFPPSFAPPLLPTLLPPTLSLQITPVCLDAFLSRVEQGYKHHGNPYHNATHGADVLQTVHYLLHTTGLETWFCELEVLALLLAAVIHDVNHTGTTNTFHIQS